MLDSPEKRPERETAHRIKRGCSQMAPGNIEVSFRIRLKNGTERMVEFSLRRIYRGTSNNGLIGGGGVHLFELFVVLKNCFCSLKVQ